MAMERANKKQDSLFSEEFSRMFLMCHNCNDQYTDGEKHARLLPCLHSLCFICLNKIIENNQLQCPNCKVTHTVGDVEKTCPCDQSRRGLMEFVKVKREPRSVFCSICPTRNATHRCQHCAEFLCSECKNAHKRVNATKNHTLLELDSLEQCQNINAFHPHLMCNKHPNYDLDLYCTNESCQKPICMMCAMVLCTDNNGHYKKYLDSMAQEKKNSTREQITSMEKVGTQIQRVIKEVEAEQGHVSGLEKSVEEEIDTAFASLLQIISNARSNAIKTLQNIALKKKRHLEAQEKKLEKLKNAIEESFKFADQYVAHNNYPAFLQVHQTIENRLKSLQKQFFDKIPHEMATFGFCATDLISKIQGKVNKTLNTWSVSVFPSNCSAEIGSCLTVHKSQTVLVKLRDCQKKEALKNNDLDEVLEKIDVKVSVTYLNDTVTTCEKRRKGNTNDVEVIFMPTKALDHTIEIRMFGKLVVKKQFQIKQDAENKKSEKVGYNYKRVPNRGYLTRVGYEFGSS